MSTTEQPPTPTKQIPAGTVVFAVFLVVAFLTPITLVDGPPPMQMLFTGIICGQVGVLAVWGVLGPQSLLVRWPLCLLGTEAVFCVFFVSIAVMQHGDLSGFVGGALLLPAIYLAVQSPLWALRFATGCRIVLRRHGEPLPSRSRQFRVQDMLVTTTVVALALGLASAGVSAEGSARPGAVSDGLAQLALTSVFVALWSGFVVPPCLYGAMVARHWEYSVLGVFGYIVAITSLLTAILPMLQGGAPGGIVGELFLWLLMVNGGAAAVVFGTLFLARNFDYVLLWPRRTDPADETAEAFPRDETDEQGAESADVGGNPFRS